MFNHGFSMNPKLHLKERAYYGKYRAIVTNNKDPEKRGRIKVICPAVLGEGESNWAEPCFPAGGAKDIGIGFVPLVGSLVWVEFEEGDPNRPIWVGTWWKPEDVPVEIYQEPQVTRFIIRTKHGKIIYDDTSGTITIDSKNGLSIKTSGGESEIKIDKETIIIKSKSVTVQGEKQTSTWS